MAPSASLLDRFYHLYPRKIDLSLTRIQRLLSTLDNPHLALPPVIHVAGTNGKGSVVAFLEALLGAAGYRVHVYSSPHLVRFHERIRLSPAPGARAAPVAEAALADVLERCAKANGDAPITFFEITTAAAFAAFADVAADFVLLEVGLGGRYDATNVIDSPALSVITAIDFDHAEFLGTDLAGIAREKAGILKPGCPAVGAPQSDIAEAVLRQVADDVGAPLALCGRDFDVARREDGFSFRWRDTSPLFLPNPALIGPHQIDNAGTALAGLQVLTEKGLVRPDISQALLAHGMEAVYWPARLQRLPTRLVPGLPETTDLWLDGGHNPAAARCLAHALRALRPETRRLGLVIGMLQTKDLSGFLSPFRGLADEIVFVPIRSSESGISPDAAAATGRALGFSCRTADSYQAAVHCLLDANEKPRTGKVSGGVDRVLICGSLYLAGEVLADLEAAGQPLFA